MESTNFCCYEFGEFRLDGRRRSLTKNGEKVPLPARNFDLLVYMVENSGRILEHDELLDKVWAGTFVEQATLKKGISALRQILAEKPENEFIKTIPRRGYSFISPVRVVPENEELYFVRETEKEIIVEEYIETDETDDQQTPAVMEMPATLVQTLPATELKKSRFSRTLVLGGLAAATILFGLFGFKTFFSKNIQPQFSVENVRINRITNSGKIVDTAISPDGTYLLYPAAEKDGVSLWLRQIATNSTTRLTPPARGGFWGLDFAPDNSYIYYIFKSSSETEKSGLYKIPLLGGVPRKIYEDISSVVASPDGKRIAFIHLSDKVEVFTANTDGEDVKTVGAFSPGFSLAGISWTPDGTSLLMTLRKKLEDKALYYISELSTENGRETIILPPQDKIIYGGTWLPDKSAIIVTMREPNADIRQIWQYFPDNQEWRRVTNDDNSYKFANLTRDGKTIVSKQESRLAAIWIAGNSSLLDKKTQDKKSLLDNSDNFRQITEGMNNFDRLGWISDNQIMFSSTDESHEIISVINSTGANARKITNGEDGIWLAPSVAGSKQSVCLLSSQKGLKQVSRVDVDGRNVKILTQSDTSIYTAHILRDNTTVLYTTPKLAGVFLFKQTADGQTVQLTESNTGLFAVTADEKFLAVEVLDKNTGKLVTELRSLENNSVIKTFNIVSGRELHFTPDGKFIAYDAPLGEFNQIMLQPIESGEPFSLTSFQADYIWSFDWSPDGNNLAVIRGKQLSDAVIIKTASR